MVVDNEADPNQVDNSYPLLQYTLNEKVSSDTHPFISIKPYDHDTFLLSSPENNNHAFCTFGFSVKASSSWAKGI